MIQVILHNFTHSLLHSSLNYTYPSDTAYFSRIRRNSHHRPGRGRDGILSGCNACGRVFLAARRESAREFSPCVSVFKSLKGLDPGMIEAFRSHCRQSYAGEYELLFGVASLADPAVQAVEQLKSDFPEHSIRLIVCPDRLGTNGKVSTLVQLAAHARYDYLLINDSDITV